MHIRRINFTPQQTISVIRRKLAELDTPNFNKGFFLLYTEYEGDLKETRDISSNGESAING